jgi:uncharacterized protein YgbK (DUF1537 family)
VKQLAIIADDLTSATDCGIQVARSGLRTLVLLGEYRITPESQETDVISIDTDTRGMPANVAYRIVKETTLRIRRDAYENIYKSLDSTLRGNLGAEIDAVMDAYDFDLAAIAPAFPFYGRTTVNGRHFLNGIPLTETEFARDPRSPVKEDNLIKLFSSQSKRRVGLLDLDVLRGGEAAVLERMEGLRRQGIELVVFDAQVEEDLDRIVQTASKTNCRVLWVGSTGLARCIPTLLRVQTRKTARSEPPCTTHQVMLVSGSVSEVARKQLDTLRAVSGVIMVEMNPLEIIADEANAKREMERCRSQLARGLDSGKDTALQLRSSREEVAATKVKGREMGLEETQVSMRVAAALARVTEEIVNRHELRGLILTGGDTSKTICSRLGGIGIELLEEVEPGIPLGRLLGTGLLVITKAGGFGTPHSLVNSLKTMKRE